MWTKTPQEALATCDRVRENIMRQPNKALIERLAEADAVAYIMNLAIDYLNNRGNNE